MPAVVLVVDPSAADRARLRALLALDGHRVIEAADGRSALGLLAVAATRVDLLLSDLYMPFIDGVTLSRTARRLPHRRDLPVVVLTSEDDEEMRARGLMAGVTAWLVEPVPSDRLRRVVALALGLGSAAASRDRIAGERTVSPHTPR
jgi:two-component system chemotaxis response regulator CheY